MQAKALELFLGLIRISDEFEMESRFLRALPSVFRGATLLELARGKHPRVLDMLVPQAGIPVENNLNLGAVFDALYTIMRRQYRCEYLFKNALANKIVLGRHSLRTTTLLTELRVEACKADIVILNGTSTVYEVKTKLDNLDRLNDQLKAYRNVFDRICVIVDEGDEHRIVDSIGKEFGVLVLTKRYTVTTIREPLSNAEWVSASSIFDTLRLGEYSSILKREIGYVPDVPNGLRYRECKRLFETLSPRQAHDGMVTELKKRASASMADAFILNLPQSLRTLGIVTPLSVHEQKLVLERISAPYRPN